MTRAAALQTTTSLDRMCAEPLGRALVGDGFVYAQPTPALFCTAVWGRPDSRALAPLLAALPLELGPAIAPHAAKPKTTTIELDASTMTVPRRDHFEAGVAPSVFFTFRCMLKAS